MTITRLDRFTIIRELGAGEQGTVYLAEDSRLKRKVAIKTLHQHLARTELLLHEATIVSQLQHPNILPLFDAGLSEGTTYLVYAWIDGQTLRQRLQQEKVLSAVQAATLALDILNGLSYAHQQGIVHLDIKPENIMLDNTGAAMLMDFGLARWTSEQQENIDVTLSGTPRYSAPELIAGQAATFLADIYSVGTLLYEMATGEFAVPGEQQDVINHADSQTVVSPSARNQQIDQQLENIILKAIARNTDKRYGDAAEMAKDLKNYLGNQEAEQFGHNHGALEFLLRRMRSKKDFPTITDSIGEINKIVASDMSSNSRLTSVILQDFSLTSKLLKMVNAAVYGQFGGAVNTVSKAVTILGFETIRNIAASLIFIDFLQNKQQAVLLQDELSHALLASITAAQLSVGQEVKDAEEVMLCAMFYNLGRLLAVYYFFEETQEIARLIEQGRKEDQAAQKVLGLTLHELGIGVARHWHFSSRLTQGMNKLQTIHQPHSELDRINTLINLSNDLCEAARYTPPERKPAECHRLIKRYAPALSLTVDQLTQALDTGLQKFTKRARLLDLKVGGSSLLETVRRWNGVKGDHDTSVDSQTEVSEIARLDSTLKNTVEELEAYKRLAGSEQILGAGIQDVTSSLISNFALNDVLQMILETIYRGIGFRRALILTRDNRSHRMMARYGLGADVDQIIPDFHFSLNYEPDVFHLAINKGVDIAIEDTRASNIVERIPSWYQQQINAPCFLLLPAMVNDKAMCLFYADMEHPSSMNTSKQQLTLLRTLRNQAVLAIKQKI